MVETNKETIVDLYNKTRNAQQVSKELSISYSRLLDVLHKEFGVLKRGRKKGVLSGKTHEIINMLKEKPVSQVIKYFNITRQYAYWLCKEHKIDFISPRKERKDEQFPRT